MCKFFSFISDPSKPVPERFMYFDWEKRQKILTNNPKNYEPDSHSSIAAFYGYNGKAEDSLNKYEYNPLLAQFKVDQINSKINDADEAEKWVRDLDFTKAVAPLVIKPIIHPFKMSPPEITPEVLALLKQWDSVRASVWDSVWDSVGDSVRASVRDSVWDSVGDSVGDSVWASVGASVGDSVWASVRASVWASVRASVGASVGASVRASVGASVRASVGDSVWAYISTFFNIPYKYDFSSVIKLWEMGFVPSFDGKIWRLHGEENAAILWQGEI